MTMDSDPADSIFRVMLRFLGVWDPASFIVILHGQCSLMW